MKKTTYLFSKLKSLLANLLHCKKKKGFLTLPVPVLSIDDIGFGLWGFVHAPRKEVVPQLQSVCGGIVWSSADSV